MRIDHRSARSNWLVSGNKAHQEPFEFYFIVICVWSEGCGQLVQEVHWTAQSRKLLWWEFWKKVNSLMFTYRNVKFETSETKKFDDWPFWTSILTMLRIWIPGKKICMRMERLELEKLKCDTFNFLLTVFLYRQMTQELIRNTQDFGKWNLVNNKRNKCTKRKFDRITTSSVAGHPQSRAENCKSSSRFIFSPSNNL